MFLLEKQTRFLLYIECVVIFDILLMFLIFVSTFPFSSFMDFSMMSVTFLNSRLIVSTWYPPSTDDSCPVRKPCNMSLQLPAFSSDCTTAKIIKNNMNTSSGIVNTLFNSLNGLSNNDVTIFEKYQRFFNAEFYKNFINYYI